MGLKQSIVIKSEFTNNTSSSPGKGSRGASPGQYVMRYMAREQATEVLLPAGYDAMSFTRYMARAEATESLASGESEEGRSPLALKHRFRQKEKLSGRAFGSKGLSLSHEALVQSSETVQRAFDEGHSVQKIILSFTEEYLRETGVLDEAFVHKGRGSYKGHVDQLKLRGAITAGVEAMTKTGRYAAPEWVGTVQFDTSHVHAHLALVDTAYAPSRRKADGSDRGKINETEKRALRKGIHHALEDMKDLHAFHGQVSAERQNVAAHVKAYAHAHIADNVPLQLLVASLPKERRLWRHGSNAESMKHPNALATRLVEQVFIRDPEGSGYDAAMRAVEAYAEESRRANRLDDTETRALVERGRERLVEQSVNGLYRSIREMDGSNLSTRTFMTDIQSASDTELARALHLDPPDEGQSDAVGLVLRARGYKERERVHASEAETLFTLATAFDEADAAGYVDDSAHVMRSFYEEEQRYHMGLVDKYRRFLSFDSRADDFAIRRMTPRYDDLVTRHGRGERDAAYQNDLRTYTFDCFRQGVATLAEWEAITDRSGDRVTTRPVLPMPPRPLSALMTTERFDKVKATDVHHLSLDYAGKDARIDQKNTMAFATVFSSRQYHAERAWAYAEATGQSLSILDRTRDDLALMERAVDKAVTSGRLEEVSFQEALDAETPRQLYTLSVDRDETVSSRVRVAIEAVAQQEEELG